MTREERDAREREILRRLTAGETTREIGIYLGITWQRVQQIASRSDFPRPPKTYLTMADLQRTLGAGRGFLSPILREMGELNGECGSSGAGGKKLRMPVARLEELRSRLIRSCFICGGPLQFKTGRCYCGPVCRKIVRAAEARARRARKK